MNEYNTGRSHLILKEYGRNIQKLVDYLSTIEDKEKRTKYAHTLIILMKQITPSHKDNADSPQKFWDDLYIMSKFRLDVDSPYPQPEKDVLERKPDKVPYQYNRIKYRHYGKNLELLVEKAIGMEDPEEKEAAIIYMGKLMKSFYLTWNNDLIEDDILIKQIGDMSQGKLTIDLEKVKKDNLFETLYKEKKKTYNSNNSSNRSGGSRTNRNNQNRRRKN